MQGTPAQPTRPTDEIDDARRKKDNSSLTQATQEEERDIPQEELIDKIKAITNDGSYSVQFDNQKEINQLVVKIFDNATEEIVKQFPAEELIGSKIRMADLRGNFVNITK